MCIDEDSDILFLIHYGLEPFDVVTSLQHQVDGVSCTRGPIFLASSQATT
jgi:hypothetical protein